jgi:adhesin transport system membrane fusion protein
MSVLSLFRSRSGPQLRPSDIPYVSPVAAAQVLEPAPAAMWAVYLMLVGIAVALAWASMAQVDIIAKANGRIVPDGREQVIASLEGGILRELLVKEGQQVTEGQALAMLDPTRFEAQQAEGNARKLALQASLARLQAEATGRPLQFPQGLPEAVEAAERDSHEARQRVLTEAVETSRRSAALLSRELAMAEFMSGKGLMSEVEVMRVRRQVNELNQQTQERISRFRQEASGEMVRVRNELTLLDEQMVVRDDALRRTTLISPVHGIIKTIKVATIGGVVGPGAPLIEILPLGPRVLVEARVKPTDIGFVKLGQEVQIKLNSYDFTLYGMLHGTVVSISPDAIGDPDKAALPEGTWYRAMVRADISALQQGDKPLPVLPGMTGQVEIRTGQRSVLAFMLRPMLRSHEAFRER